jgi:ubiquinone/menaquinone biosynthesis C-methylase UbiE
MSNSPKISPLAAFFDHAADDWDEAGPPMKDTLARLETLREEMGLGPERDVLEVGCGTGQVTAWLAETVAPGRVTAIDVSPRMLARARARTDAALFLQEDVCAADLGKASFDIAFCMHVFPHLEDRDAALANLQRLLRPDGRLVIVHLSHWRTINEMHDRLGDAVMGHHLPPPNAWERILHAHGFALEHLRDEANLLLVVGKRS